MIRSPCIDVCRLIEGRDICQGCHRTLAEIARWSEMSDAERERVLAALPDRRRALQRTEQDQR